jgi:hypothetical protein
MMRTKRALTALMVTIISCLALAVANVCVSANDDVIVQTNLSGPAINGLTPSGVALHRTQTDGSRRFRVEVEDVNLPAGTVLNVLVNGTNIGTFTINSFRQGELERNTNDGQTVPNVNVGTVVSVRTQNGATVASGTFGAASPTPSPGASPSPSPSPSPGATPSPSPSPSPDGDRARVSFESASYSVAEDGRSIGIKILRTGDISRDSKVDYRTTNGTAQERSDYTTAAGRLFFAPGEPSKTITVLITDDAFVEGDETVNLMLFDAGRSTSLGTPANAVLTIKDNDTTASATNPVDVTKTFVIQHYMDFLNREPEPEGLKAWQEIVDNCPRGDSSCDKIEVSSAFFRSPEFQDRGYFIFRFYSAILGRVPRYDEFAKDMTSTSGFQSDAEKEANKNLFTQDFMARAEFADRYNNLSDADFVNALVNAAGVILPNKDSLISALQTGQMTRWQVLRSITESAEVRTKFYTEAFVVMQYFGYLRRDPDVLYLEWIRIMKENGGDYRGMINGFMNSGEYRQRFGQ